MGPHSKMNITVILCTYNRCDSLANALQSLAVQTFASPVEWEVLVVDNNSTDRTREIVERFCGVYPNRFRYMFEPRPGKSYALNTGIQHGDSEILAFTDDDIIAEPTWLENLTSVFVDETWAGSSGRTLPEKNVSLPHWLSVRGPHTLAPLAIFDLGAQHRELKDSPFGNNMAYRRVMFEKYGRFRTDLGPRADSSEPQKSEDSEFGCRLLAAKERLYYEPSAVIYHSIPSQRLCEAHFLAWWFDKARADIRAHGISAGTKWFVAGVPIYMLRRLVVWTARWITTLDPGRRFDCKTKVWTLLGEIEECHRVPMNILNKKRVRNATT